MLFRQLFDANSCTYTYLIASDYGREALLIDPVLEQMPLYEKLLAEFKLQLLVSIETHMHADHITAAGQLQKKFNSEIIMGKHTIAEHVNIKVKEGEKINLDGIILEAIYTPGHTNDSYSYRMNDRVFTGDTLLIRGTGRTDFQEGDPYKQYDSLFNKLLKLPEQTLVFPAHDYKGMLVSTIGEEKNLNPRLQVRSAEDYASIMKNLNLAKPNMMDVAVPANLKCGIR
jgi:glyoxylase-like metal-dependent hydrolase (beta-lactamase superfamily II)